jgi:hypothetical protein
MKIVYDAPTKSQRNQGTKSKHIQTYPNISKHILTCIKTYHRFDCDPSATRAFTGTAQSPSPNAEGRQAAQGA